MADDSSSMNVETIFQTQLALPRPGGDQNYWQRFIDVEQIILPETKVNSR